MKAFTEEVTSELDLKRQIWKEGGGIPKKENNTEVCKGLVRLEEEEVLPGLSLRCVGGGSRYDSEMRSSVWDMHPPKATPGGTAWTGLRPPSH